MPLASGAVPAAGPHPLVPEWKVRATFGCGFTRTGDARKIR
jgi:hypothetical protein